MSLGRVMCKRTRVSNHVINLLANSTVSWQGIWWSRFITWYNIIDCYCGDNTSLFCISSLSQTSLSFPSVEWHVPLPGKDEITWLMSGIVNSTVELEHNNSFIGCPEMHVGTRWIANSLQHILYHIPLFVDVSYFWRHWKLLFAAMTTFITASLIHVNCTH